MKNYWLILLIVALLVSACGDRAAETATDATSSTEVSSDADSTQLVLWVHCGARFLEFDGSLWEATIPEAASTIDWLPESWEPFVDSQENLVLSIALNRELLTAIPVEGGQPVEFASSPSQSFGCE